MSIVVRRTEDLQAVHELDRLTFPLDTPTIDHPREPTHEWWIAEDDGLPVGFIGLSVSPTSVGITRVGVLPAARGLGLQKRLVRVAMRWARGQGFLRMHTYVRADNIPSLRGLLAAGLKPYRTSVSESGAPFIEVEAKLN